MGWKDPLDPFKGRKSKPREPTIDDRLDQVIEKTRKAPPQYHDAGGVARDYGRSAFDRADQSPAFHRFGELSIPTSQAAVVPEVSNEERFDTITILNVAGAVTATSQLVLRLRLTDIVDIPVSAGMAIPIAGATRVVLDNQQPNTVLVYYALSRNGALVVPHPLSALLPPVAGSLAQGTVSPLMVATQPSGAVLPIFRLMVDSRGRQQWPPFVDQERQPDGSDTTHATPWEEFITGLGTATLQLVRNVSVGDRVYLTDLSLVALAPATATRATYYLGAGGTPIIWHHAVKTGEGSAQHSFGFYPRRVLDDLYVDIGQSGTASPWWVLARGYLLP